jgi:diguanylate cyclase (GGDEF)-like protein/PAS domain S-box-containing protein
MGETDDDRSTGAPPGPGNAPDDPPAIPLRVVVLEDNPSDAELIARQLRDTGYRVDLTHAHDEKSFTKALEIAPDLILSDYSLPTLNAIQALTLLKERGLDVPFIVVTGTLVDAAAAECIKLGAADYLLKDRLARLPAAVAQAYERKLLRTRHAHAMQMFEGLAATIHEVFYQCSPDFREIRYVSPSYEAVWGRTCDSLYANPKSWMESIHGEDLPVVLRNIGPTLTTDSVFEYRITRPDGSLRWIQNRHYPVYGAAGKVEHINGTAEDITVRKEAEARIAHLNRVYAMLSGINTLIVRVRDRDELFRDACRVAVEEGGFRMSLICIVDQSTSKIVPIASAGKDEGLMTLIERILSSEKASTTMVARAIREKKPVVANDSRTDPRVLFGRNYVDSGVCSQAVLPLIVGDEAIGVIALYSAEPEFFQEGELKLLTELAADIGFAVDHLGKQERLHYLAYYDVLTGLANRSLLLERVAQYMRSAAGRGHKLALILIDLQRFKNINDSLGRLAGDALLRQVAEWLIRNVGDANLLARVGADHFAVMVPEVRHEEGLVRLIEKTIQAFPDHPFHLDDRVFHIAAKVGVALFPDDGATVDTLFKNAEAALQKAKRSGESYLFYRPAMNAAVVETLILENKMKRALEKDEFVLHYQPKVDVKTGAIKGMEALIRWNDPDSGLVPPMKFIPLLEETGLIIRAGRWAMRKALEDHLGWRSDFGRIPRIAVNVSPLQLRQKDFVEVVASAIAEARSEASCLELEITESLIMENIEETIPKLRALRAMGVEIAIDDFGTGYSSLAYLARLPVHTIKIDRSFIVQMPGDPDSMAIVTSVISLAHSLRLKVVAEGVDSRDQFKLLKLLNCDEAQGYLISKPLSVADLRNGPKAFPV